MWCNDWISLVSLAKKKNSWIMTFWTFDHIFLSCSIHARTWTNLFVFKLLAPLLIEVPYYLKTLCNAISLVFFIYHFRKTIIILIMYYVYKWHKKTNQENTRIGIYLNNLERYKFEMAKGLQRCVSNEHLDHKENNFPTFFSEDRSLSMA